jgi:hypothetical protein
MMTRMLWIINKIINRIITTIILMVLGITMGMCIAFQKRGKGLTYSNIEALYRLGRLELSLRYKEYINIIFLKAEWYVQVKKFIWMVYLNMEHYVFNYVMKIMVKIAYIISFVSGMDANKVMLQYGNWIFILAVILIIICLLVVLTINNYKEIIFQYEKYKKMKEVLVYPKTELINFWIRDRRLMENIVICQVIIMIFVVFGVVFDII